MWKITLKKMEFADFVKDAKSRPSHLLVFLFAANFESDRMTSHKHGLAAKTVLNWRPPKSIFQDDFLQDSEHFRLKFRWVAKSRSEIPTEISA